MKPETMKIHLGLHEAIVKELKERNQTASTERMRQYKEAMNKAEKSAFDTQVDGDHYKVLGVQPLEAVLKNKGYVAFSGACYTKVLKYMDRNKGDEVINLKKAAHVLSMWIEEAERQNDSSN